MLIFFGFLLFFLCISNNILSASDSGQMGVRLHKEKSSHRTDAKEKSSKKHVQVVVQVQKDHKKSGKKLMRRTTAQKVEECDKALPNRKRRYKKIQGISVSSSKESTQFRFSSEQVTPRQPDREKDELSSSPDSARSDSTHSEGSSASASQNPIPDPGSGLSSSAGSSSRSEELQYSTSTDYSSASELLFKSDSGLVNSSSTEMQFPLSRSASQNSAVSSVQNSARLFSSPSAEMSASSEIQDTPNIQRPVSPEGQEHPDKNVITIIGYSDDESIPLSARPWPNDVPPNLLKSSSCESIVHAPPESHALPSQKTSAEPSQGSSNSSQQSVSDDSAPENNGSGSDRVSDNELSPSPQHHGDAILSPEEKKPEVFAGRMLSPEYDRFKEVVRQTAAAQEIKCGLHPLDEIAQKLKQDLQNLDSAQSMAQDDIDTLKSYATCMMLLIKSLDTYLKHLSARRMQKIGMFDRSMSSAMDESGIKFLTYFIELHMPLQRSEAYKNSGGTIAELQQSVEMKPASNDVMQEGYSGDMGLADFFREDLHQVQKNKEKFSNTLSQSRNDPALDLMVQQILCKLRNSGTTPLNDQRTRVAPMKVMRLYALYKRIIADSLGECLRFISLEDYYRGKTDFFTDPTIAVIHSIGATLQNIFTNQDAKKPQSIQNEFSLQQLLDSQKGLASKKEGN